MNLKRSVALVAAVAAASFAATSGAWAGISITGVSPITENFNGMTTSATAPLPSGWVIVSSNASPVYSLGSGNTTAAASSGAPTTGGAYNWGLTATPSDRAVGFMTSGTFASPGSVMVKLDNNTGSTVSEFDFSYDIERYRINTAAAQVNLFTSTDGTNWNPQTSGDTGVFATGGNAYTFSTAQTVVSKSVSLTGLNVLTGTSFYIRWNFNTTGGNSQGLGLDNFSLTPVLTAPPPPNNSILYAGSSGTSKTGSVNIGRVVTGGRAPAARSSSTTAAVAMPLQVTLPVLPPLHPHPLLRAWRTGPPPPLQLAFPPPVLARAPLEPTYPRL